MDMLEMLSAVGRKAVAVCGQARCHETAADVAYFLVTATQRHHDEEHRGTSTSSMDVAPHDSATYHRLRSRIACGTVAVAFTSAPRSGSSATATQKEMERIVGHCASALLNVQCAKGLSMRDSKAQTASPLVQLVPRVWVEAMGDVGAHMMFRDADVAMQWLTKTWKRLEAQHGHVADGSTVVLHVVYFFSLSHAQTGLVEGPLLQFLHSLDAAALAYRAASIPSDASGRTPFHLVPSVVIEAVTPLVGSIARERLTTNVSLQTAPRIVVTSVVQRNRLPLPTEVVDAALEHFLGRWTTPCMLHNPINAPLCVFLRDVAVLLGVVFEASVLEALQSAWCVSHSIDDVVAAMHMILCPFRHTCGVEGQLDPPDAAINTAHLHQALAVAASICGETYEAQTTAYACLLEGVARGRLSEVSLKPFMAAWKSTQIAGLATIGIQQIRDASLRVTPLKWLSLDRWRRAVAIASLEPPLDADSPQPSVGSRKRSRCEANVSPTAVALAPFRSESEEILATLTTTPCVSLKGAMTSATLLRVQPVDDSMQDIRRVSHAGNMSVSHAPVAMRLNFFHTLVPASIRVLSVLTLQGASSRTAKGRWVPVDRLNAMCCGGDEDLLLHAVRQLRIAGLIVVNGVNQSARSILV